ncbi:MAG: hypothetical protein JXR94_21375 [Candidatus Hydrogenedentes bacterium]|nr:hypothetical protein [Candidatus Hydrogenedentota bacterium]
MSEMWLAVEGGGTKTRVLLADTECAIVARAVGGPASPMYIKQGEYLRKVLPMLKRIKRLADKAGGQVSTAGFGGPMATGIVMNAVRSVFGEVHVVHAGEMEIALAVNGLRHGVALIAGTGATCAGITPDGKRASCGGFGAQFGDEGCGYWIGREAVAAARRANEGRGPQSSLGARLCEFYAIGTLTHILRFCDKSGHVPVPKVAACVPCVFEAARDGDVVAKSICRAAGRALGRLLVAVVERLGHEEPVPVAMTGGVFNGGPLILKSFHRILRESGFAYTVFPPVPEPTVGIFKYIEREREKEMNGVS